MTDNSLLQYIILNLFLLLSFCLIGRNISKGGKYWKNAIWAIIIFTFISGSRFARGNDYPHYVDIYEYNMDTDYLFAMFNHVLKFFNVQAYFIFYFYAFIFVTCLMAFLKPFKKQANLVFPLALMATLSFEEFQIRQAFSFSFVFLFTYELMFSKDKKKTKIVICTILFFITIGLHSANTVVLLLILFLFLFFRTPIPLKFSIPLYIFGSYVISNLGDLGFLQPILDVLGSGNSDSKISEYAQQSDRWFSADAKEDVYTRNALVKVFETCGNIALLYLGHKALKIQRDVRQYTFYNLFFIGTFIQQSFMNLEILNRMGGDIMVFWFIPLSLVLSNGKRLFRKGGILNKLFGLMLVWWVYTYVRYIFTPDNNMTLFLWDLYNLA